MELGISLVCMTLYLGHAWMAWQIYIHYLPVKEGRLWKALSFLALYISTDMPIRIGDRVNILGVLLLALAGILWLTRGALHRRVSLGLLFYAGVISISAICDEFLLFPGKAGWIRLLIVLPRTVLWGVLWLFFRKHYPKGELRLPLKLWGLLDVLGCMPVAAVLVLLNLTAPGTENRMVVYCMMAVSGVSFAGLLYLLSLLDEHARMEEEQTLWEIRSLHYENLEKEQTALRRMRHDIANHLRTLSGLQGEEAAAYLQEWMDSPALKKTRRYCENEVVNLVLASKAERMEELGIEGEFRLRLPEQLPMGKMELCALFANGMDNALEACERVEIGERFLKLSAVWDRGLLMIELKNAMAHAPEADGERLRTSKRDKNRHGLGLAEIQSICESYGGAAKAAWSGREFTLTCSLPLGKNTGNKGNDL